MPVGAFVRGVEGRSVGLSASKSGPECGFYNLNCLSTKGLRRTGFVSKFWPILRFAPGGRASFRDPAPFAIRPR